MKELMQDLGGTTETITAGTTITNADMIDKPEMS